MSDDRDDLDDMTDADDLREVARAVRADAAYATTSLDSALHKLSALQSEMATLRATHDAAIRERDELRAAFDIESARIEKIAAYVGAADYIDSIGPVLGAIDAAIRAAEERAYRRAADKARDKILDRGRKCGHAYYADTAQAVHAAVVALIGGDR